MCLPASRLQVRELLAGFDVRRCSGRPQRVLRLGGHRSRMRAPPGCHGDAGGLSGRRAKRLPRFRAETEGSPVRFSTANRSLCGPCFRGLCLKESPKKAQETMKSGSPMLRASIQVGLPLPPPSSSTYTSTPSTSSTSSTSSSTSSTTSTTSWLTPWQGCGCGQAT